MSRLLQQKTEAFQNGYDLAAAGETMEFAASVALGLGRLEGDFLNGFESFLTAA